MYSNNGVVGYRSMTNVPVVNNRSLWLIIGMLHALVSSRMVCKLIIARDSDFDLWKLDDFQTKQ